MLRGFVTAPRIGRQPRPGLPARIFWLALSGLAAAVGCGGSAWINEPLPDSDEDDYTDAPPGSAAPASAQPAPGRLRARAADQPRSEPAPAVTARRRVQGRVVGTFRNTYYDFPSEREHPRGSPVALMDAQCRTIKAVPRAFFETVCVQGSGMLASGTTVSFARRDCECAELCPRTQQRICFDVLDRKRFPWGRGATGRPITPLLTVAVDSNVIPLDTPIYIPQFDGLPRDVDRTSLHDGCFIAQDRGLRVKGRQVDVFTGHSAVTRLWNKLVPSNQGVTVVLENPRCARAHPGAE